MLQERTPVGQGDGGGRVARVGAQHAFVGLARAVVVAVPVPDPSEQQCGAGQRAGCGGGALGEFGGLFGEVDGGHGVAGVEGGPAQLLQDAGLQLRVADVAGQGECLVEVGAGVVVAAQVAAGPAAAHQGLGQPVGFADGPCGFHGLRDQLLGVDVGEAEVRDVRRREPRRDRPRPVAGLGEVARGGLGTATQHPGGPAVPGDADRLGHRGVGDLADDVVAEPEALALGDDQARPQRPARAPRAVLDVEPAQLGHVVEGEGHAEHGALREEQRDRLAGVLDASGDRVLQRGRDRYPAARRRRRRLAQQLGEEQRRSASPGQQLVGVVAGAGPLDEDADVGVGERTQVDAARDVAQDVGDRLVLRGALGEDDHRAAALPVPGQQVQGLERRGAGVLHVLDDQQHRLAGREPHDEARERVEAAAVFELGRRPGVGRLADDAHQLGHQLGERADAVARDLPHLRGRHPVHDGADRLHERLQVQRPLGLEAVDAQDEPTGATRLGGEGGDQGALADAGLAGDDGQCRAARGGAFPQLAQHGQLGVAADDGLDPVGDADVGLARGMVDRVGALGAQHRQEQGLRGGGGVASELLGHRDAQRAVGDERRAGTPGPLVAEHDGAAGLLVERVVPQGRGGDLDGRVERAELDGGGAPADPGAAEQPFHRPAQCVDPGAVVFAREGDVGVEELRGVLGARRRQGAAAVGELELRRLDEVDGLVEVDRDVVGDEPVAGGGPVDAFLADRLAQPADESGDVAVGPFRGLVVVPEGVDQRAHGDELAATFGEHGECPPRLPGGDGARESALDREGAEQANAQARRHHVDSTRTRYSDRLSASVRNHASTADIGVWAA
ncbi:hypothetical protein TOK_3333 [Pseudonocardia sp. N23]|nr:hypothetical protein TOK_3333 [Pseudonocardia sp. N23]